jgi:hypothetical protein
MGSEGQLCNTGLGAISAFTTSPIVGVGTGTGAGVGAGAGAGAGTGTGAGVGAIVLARGTAGFDGALKG